VKVTGGGALRLVGSSTNAPPLEVSGTYEKDGCRNITCPGSWEQRSMDKKTSGFNLHEAGVRSYKWTHLEPTIYHSLDCMAYAGSKA
jgi:hypothetical protein